MKSVYAKRERLTINDGRFRFNCNVFIVPGYSGMQMSHLTIK